MLLKPGGLADKEHLVLGGPTSAGPSCDDIYGSDRMKVGIDRKEVEIVGDVGVARQCQWFGCRHRPSSVLTAKFLEAGAGAQGARR